MLYITVPSMIGLEYPDKIEAYTGYFNSALGFGMTLGPAIAAVLYRWLKYIYTLYAFGALIFVVGITCVCFVPERLDKKQDNSQEEERVM